MSDSTSTTPTRSSNARELRERMQDSAACMSWKAWIVSAKGSMLTITHSRSWLAICCRAALTRRRQESTDICPAKGRESEGLESSTVVQEVWVRSSHHARPASQAPIDLPPCLSRLLNSSILIPLAAIIRESMMYRRVFLVSVSGRRGEAPKHIEDKVRVVRSPRLCRTIVRPALAGNVSRRGLTLGWSGH